MSGDLSLTEAARRLLEEGESVTAVLALFQELGSTGMLPMVQALRQVVGAGPSGSTSAS